MSSLIIDASNTEMCGASTPERVGITEENVAFVLDTQRRRRYRRNMTKKPAHGLRGIRPECLRAAFLLAKRNRDVSQGDIARALSCDQQTISRLLYVGPEKTKGTKEGGWKWPLVQYLGPELWQIALEKKELNLLSLLRTLGLSPKDDDVMTISQRDREIAEPEYTYDLYEPWLVRGDSMLVFPSRPTAKILPPNFPHSDKSYAFRMIGDMMRPRYESGEILDVDPETPPAVGEYCVFYKAGRINGRVGKLVSISPDKWRIVTRPETRFEEGHDLPTAEWSICEVVVGSRRK